MKALFNTFFTFQSILYCYTVVWLAGETPSVTVCVIFIHWLSVIRYKRETRLPRLIKDYFICIHNGYVLPVLCSVNKYPDVFQVALKLCLFPDAERRTRGWQQRQSEKVFVVFGLRTYQFAGTDDGLRPLWSVTV